MRQQGPECRPVRSSTRYEPLPNDARNDQRHQFTAGVNNPLPISQGTTLFRTSTASGAHGTRNTPRTPHQTTWEEERGAQVRNPSSRRAVTSSESRPSPKMRHSMRPLHAGPAVAESGLVSPRAPLRLRRVGKQAARETLSVRVHLLLTPRGHEVQRRIPLPTSYSWRVHNLHPGLC